MKELVKNRWFPNQLFDFFLKLENRDHIYQNHVFEFFFEKCGYESLEFALIATEGLFLFLITAPNPGHSVTR